MPMTSRRLVCRERSIVRGDGGRFTTPPSSRRRPSSPCLQLLQHARDLYRRPRPALERRRDAPLVQTRRELAERRRPLRPQLLDHRLQIGGALPRPRLAHDRWRVRPSVPDASGCCGLPSFSPRAFAAASAALVRCEISPASCSATAAIWVMHELARSARGKSAVAEHNVGIAAALDRFERKWALRLSRSSLAITSVAPWRRQAASAAWSFGRSAVACPLSTSTNSAISSHAPPFEVVLDRLALRLEAEAGASLPVGRDPQVADDTGPDGCHDVLAPCSGGSSTRYQAREEEEQGRKQGKWRRRCGPTATRRRPWESAGVLVSDPQRPSLRLTDGGRKALREPAGCGAAKSSATERFVRVDRTALLRRLEMSPGFSATSSATTSSDAATASTSSTSPDASTSPRRCRRLKDRREPSSSSASRARASAFARGLELRDDPLQLHQLLRRQRPERRGHVDPATRCRLLLNDHALAPASRVANRSQRVNNGRGVAARNELVKLRLREIDEHLSRFGPSCLDHRVGTAPQVERVARDPEPTSRICHHAVRRLQRLGNGLCRQMSGRDTRARASVLCVTISLGGDDLEGCGRMARYSHTCRLGAAWGSLHRIVWDQHRLSLLHDVSAHGLHGLAAGLDLMDYAGRKCHD